MGITISDFIQAIAVVLKELYPEYDVYADKIGQHGYENCFYVSNIDASQNPKQPTRYQRLYDFDILFFHEADDRMSFYDWVDVMMQNFDRLQVDDDLYFTKDFETKEIDDVFHCLFSVDFRVKEIVDEPVMERLHQKKGRIKK